MMICWAVPIVILVFFFQVFPIVFALGISGPTFVCALLYNKTFKRFEPEENSDEWSLATKEEMDHADTESTG